MSAAGFANAPVSKGVVLLTTLVRHVALSAPQLTLCAGLAGLCRRASGPVTLLPSAASLLRRRARARPGVSWARSRSTPSWARKSSGAS